MGGLLAFRVGNYDHTAEREQFRFLCEQLKSRYENSGDFCVFAGNYNIGCELDALVIKKDAIVVVEFKNYEGRVIANENGEWTCDGKIIAGGSRKTVLQQARINHSTVKRELKVLGVENNQIVDVPHLVVFHGKIELVNNLSATNKSWLHVTDDVHFIEKLDDITCPRTDLNPLGIVNLAQLLKLDAFYLKEYSNAEYEDKETEGLEESDELEDPEESIPTLSSPVNPTETSLETDPELVVPTASKEENPSNDDSQTDPTFLLTKSGNDMQLYPQQTEALNAMRRFIYSDCSVFILKGYAGTGKTTMIKSFCDELKTFNRKPLLMAPTGRAAKVLSEKTGIEATTIHKAIYHRTKFDLTHYDENGKLLKAAKDEPHTDVDDLNIFFGIKEITDIEEAKRMVVIVDEASLISSKPSSQEIIHFGTDVILDDLLTYAQLSLGAKIVFVGDPAQLPPVGDNVSSALNESYFNKIGISVKSFTLSEVVRQKSESLILANAMKVRNCLNATLRNELDFDTKAGEVEKITASDVVTKYLEIHPAPKLGQSVVICFSNTQTSDYNEAIRCGYFTSEGLHNGDLLQVVRNNYNVSTNDGVLWNGDFIRVISDPGEIETHKVPVWVNRDGKRERVYIELEFQNIEFETDRGQVGHTMLLTNLLRNNRPNLSREENVALYIDFVIRNKSIRKPTQDFTQALMTDLYFNSLQAKYGYAITGHKSQGGEWGTVFVDYTGRTGLDDDSLRWIYTATTRAVRCLFGVNLPHVTPFNKVTISPISTVSKINADIVCVKDSNCDLLPQEATPSQKAKCNSIVAALEEHHYTIQSVICKPYRDRYVIQGGFGQKQFDCQYNGSGIYTSYSSLQPSDEDALVLQALKDNRCYDYDYQYTPSLNVLDKLYRAIASAADDCNIKITGIKEYPIQYYVLYGLRTSAPFATLQFYFSGKGFVARAMAASPMGADDELLKQMINRIQRIACQ